MTTATQTPVDEILRAIVEHTASGGTLLSGSPLVAMAAMRIGAPVPPANRHGYGAEPALPAKPSPLALPSPTAPLLLAAAPSRDDRVRHLSALLNQPLGLAKRTPFAAYLAAPGTNASRLRDLARSALLYQHRQSSPLEPTEPMRLGTCAHTAVLEPHKFLSEYALWDERTESDPEKVAPRRVGTKKYDAFLAANPGKTIIRADEHATAMAMRDAVRAKADAAKYLRTGDPEVAMFWCDPRTERLCKGRADWITTIDGGDVIVGLKSARDCRAAPFGIAAAKFGYPIQWAFYQDGYRAITGRTPRVVEIVIESTAPHDIVVYDVPERALNRGRQQYTRLLDKLGACETANAWPGVAEGEQTLELPEWFYADATEDGDLSDLGLDAGDEPEEGDLAELGLGFDLELT